MKRTGTALLILLLAAGLLFNAARSAHSEIVNGIAAKVGEEIITLYELNKEYERAQFSARLLGKKPPDRMEVLDNLIDDMLLKREAARRGLFVSDAELEEVVHSVKQQNNLTDEQFERQLKAEQLTVDDLKESYRLEILQNRLINMLSSANANRITAGEVEEFYNNAENKDLFTVPAQVELADIYLPSDPEATMQEALELKNFALSIYEELKAGASFDELAALHSQAPNNTEGGYLGSFTRAQLSMFMKQQDIQTVFAQEEGEVAPPVRLADGYHLFKVISKQEQETLPLDEASERIKSYLLRKKGQELFKEWLQDARAETQIQIVLSKGGDEGSGTATE
jgi:peptidyl-prolyl cis-trans isomerase SurA